MEEETVRRSVSDVSEFECRAPWSGWFKKKIGNVVAIHHWKIGKFLSSCGNVELMSDWEATHWNATNQPAEACGACKEYAVQTIMPSFACKGVADGGRLGAVPCNNKTRHPSGRCHAHRDQK